MILNEMKGNVVEQLQTKLGLAVTGKYDQATRVAIIGHQLEKGLPANGIVDESLWISLFGSLPQVEEQVTKQPKRKSRKDDSEVQETES